MDTTANNNRNPESQQAQPDASIRFQVDKVKRREAIRAQIAERPGRKLSVAIIATCIIATFVIPACMTVAFDGWLADGAIFAFSGLAALSVIAIGGTWRQRTAGVTVRKDEQLSLQGDILDYSFHSSGDRFPNSLNVVKIDLNEATVRFDEPLSAYVFEGDIRWNYYRDPSTERLLAPSEMRSVHSYEIGAYFGAAFDSYISKYLQH